jgi:tetratricopeptide (TPR) repeat protein
MSIARYSFSQPSGDPKYDFLDGEYFVSQGQFVEALPYFLAVLKKDPGNCNVNYRVGLCYMKQAGDEVKALPYLKKAVENIDLKYVEGKFKNPAAPPETWILIGDSYMRQNLLDDASDAYKKYHDLIGTSDSKKLAVINKRIEDVASSKELQQTSQNLQMLNLGNLINTKYSETGPVLSGDQKTLVYTQSRDAFEKIMVSHRTGAIWGTPVEITRQIGSEGDCYATGISNDGTELYVINHDEIGSDIYVSKLVKGKWQKMQPIPGKVNTKYHESSACVSPDGKYLYFSSDRPKGFGGFDLYVAEKTGDIWGNIKNLGKIINTDKDEVAPYLSADGKVLYFSSNGHKTVGNMDILYSVKDADGNWQTPVNPGKPINTTNDELSYVYFDDTKTGYISRNLPQGVGKNDLYSVVPAIEEAALPDTLPPPVAEKNLEAAIAKPDTFLNAPVIAPTEHSNITIVANETNNSSVSSQPIQKKKASNRSLTESNVKAPLDTTSIYTIQIMALQHSKNSTKIKLSSIIISEGNDGYSRYTHGEFKDLAKAQASLKNLRKKGFKDAFIRKISTIPNYSKSK